MRFLKFLTLAFICFALQNNALATNSVEKYQQKYFGYNSVSPLVIDKPFIIDSEDHKNQSKQVIILQQHIEPKDIDLALEEKQLRPETLVQHIFKSCTRDKFPSLYHLLDRVGDTSRDVTEGVKNYWRIPRPYIYDKNVQMMISPSKGYSYPSGHTTGSYLYAGVLGLLIPRKIADFQDYANQIAWHRVQVGMHYPQDLTGGKQLAIFLIGGLMQNKDFQEDFKKARQELKKAGIVK